MRTRLTLIASRPIVIVAIMLGIATSASAKSPQSRIPVQSSNDNAVQQPSGSEQTQAGDPCAPAYTIGGSVLPPVPTRTPDPKFSKEAGSLNFSGNVLVGLVVGRDGKPCNVHLLRGNGIVMMGVDESAVQSVQHYRFKPATQNGKPVAVNLKVEVFVKIGSGDPDHR